MGTTLLTCGNDLLTCGNDFLTCGNKIKKCKENSSMSLPGLHINSIRVGFFMPPEILRVGFFMDFPKSVGFSMVGVFNGGFFM